MCATASCCWLILVAAVALVIDDCRPAVIFPGGVRNSRTRADRGYSKRVRFPILIYDFGASRPPPPDRPRPSFFAETSSPQGTLNHVYFPDNYGDVDVHLPDNVGSQVYVQNRPDSDVSYVTLVPSDHTNVVFPDRPEHRPSYYPIPTLGYNHRPEERPLFFAQVSVGSNNHPKVVPPPQRSRGISFPNGRSNLSGDNYTDIFAADLQEIDSDVFKNGDNDSFLTQILLDAPIPSIAQLPLSKGNVDNYIEAPSNDIPPIYTNLTLKGHLGEIKAVERDRDGQEVTVTTHKSECPKLYGSVDLFCNIDHPGIQDSAMTMRWKRRVYSGGHIVNQEVSNGGELLLGGDRYSLEHSSNKYRLHVDDVEPADCGSYECEITTNGRTVSSTVVVFICH